MPGFDGTGPQGAGPMTGRGMGFCVLQKSEDHTGQVEGLAGINGTPVGNQRKNQTEEKEVMNMPRGDRTGPTGMGPMTGRAAGFCAGYPAPGFMNPVGARGYAPAPAGGGYYGYGQPAYSYNTGFTAGGGRFGRAIPGAGLVRGFGRGRGFRAGRGRFGRW